MKMIKRIRNMKSDLICISLLLIIYLAVIIIITRFQFAYGSSMDWNNQHYAIPEYLRNLFYETKNFFPSFAPNIGAGQNIYNFSYYGLYNPLIMFSYLLPFVSMSAYIQAISIISVMVSVIMFYFWIKRRYDIKIAFFISCLFLLSSPVIFHSHRHIMFVSYFPFLIGALYCCDSFFEKKNRAGLIFCLAMIMLTSYYFSIGSYLAVLVYITALYLNKNPEFKIKEYFKSVLNLAVCMIVSVMITAVLWMPTIYALLSGRANTNVKTSLMEILLPTVDYKSVLYSPYSMGLSVLSIMAVVFAIIKKRRGSRFIGIVLSAFVIFRLPSYVMNGFMYCDEKSLIPFIPLALLLSADFAAGILKKDIRLRFWTALNIGIIIGGALFIIISKEYKYSVPIVLDMLSVNIAYFMYNKNNSRRFFISIVTAVVFAFCLKVNLLDKLCKTEDLIRVDKEYLQEIEESAFSDGDSSIYRSSLFADEGVTMNKVYGKNYYTTTVYSSLQNQLYNHFYYDEFQNEMPHRNSAIVSENDNPFFYLYMGKKYLFVNNSVLKSSMTVPYGYKEVKKSKNLTLFKNENVLPLGYASSKLMSYNQYISLDYPYNMKALLDYTVVDKNLDDVNVEEIEVYDYLSDGIFDSLPENISYNRETNTITVNTAERKGKYKTRKSLKKRSYNFDKCSVKLKKPIDDYFIITCEADNNTGEKPSDVYFTVNGVKNKLTEPSWKYYNNNKKFCYVLSSDEPIESIDFCFSKGSYTLSDWRFYTVKKSELEGLKNRVDEFIVDKSKTGGDVFEGSINVTNDNSYFKMSIPFADGFEAYVDGKKTNVEKVDSAFIGFEVEKGNHNIKIVYKAPLLKEAKLVSLCGALIFALVLAVQTAGGIYAKHRKEVMLSEKYGKNDKKV